MAAKKHKKHKKDFLNISKPPAPFRGNSSVCWANLSETLTHSAPPTLGVPMSMHHSDNNDGFHVDAVDDFVWKSSRKRHPSVTVDNRISLGVSGNL